MAEDQVETSGLGNSSSKTGLWAQLPSWAQKVVAVSGWAVAVLSWVLGAPASINSFFDEAPKATENIANWWYLDKRFTGNWSNEGNVEISDEDARLFALAGSPVALNIRTYGDRVDGFIITDGLGEHWLNSLALISGIKTNDAIEGFVYGYKDGKKFGLAKIEITYSSSDDEEVLYIRTIKQPMQFLPWEARLYRTSAEAMPSGEPNVDLLMQVRSHPSKQKSSPDK